MKKRPELTPEEQLNRHFVALGHSVDLINNTIASVTDLSQVDDTIKRAIASNIHHLKIVINREQWDPAVHNLDHARAAIAAGEAFLTQFPA